MADLKKRGLGRGLDALMPPRPPPGATAPPVAVAAAPATAARAPERNRTYFPAGVEELYPSPEQPRRKFNETELSELADTLRAHGVITPLVVRPRKEGGYYLIAGERRWRAAQRAGLREVPVVVQDVSEQEAFERALVENLQRTDLGPIEEATAFQRLVDTFGLSHDDVAARMGKDRSSVANTIRLLKLPAPVRQLVDDKRLSMGHARALLGLEDAAAIERAARQVVDKAMSVRATEALVKKARTPESADQADGKEKVKPGKSASARDLEERLTRALGGPVAVVEDASGKSGQLEIRYVDLDHLDRLLDLLL